MLLDLPFEAACATDWVRIDIPSGVQVLAIPEDGRVRLECLAEPWLEAPTLAYDGAENLVYHLLALWLDPLVVRHGLIPSPEHVMIDDEGGGTCAAGNWWPVVDGPVEGADPIATLAVMELLVSVEADELDDGDGW